MAVGFHTDQHGGKVEQLQRLPEGLGRAAGDGPAVLCDGFQLGFALGIGFGAGHLYGQVGIAQDIAGDGLQHDAHTLVEFALCAECGVVHIQTRQLFLGALEQAAKAQPHQAGIIDGQVAGAGVVVEVGLENLFACLRTLELVVVQTGVDVVVQGPALPPAAQVQDLLAFGVAADVELVVLPLLKGVVPDLVQDPVDRELGIDGSRLDG